MLESQFSYLRGANDFAQVDVHPCVTAHQVPIVSLAVLQLDELKSKAKMNFGRNVKKFFC